MKQLIADYANGYELISQAVQPLSEDELNYKPTPGEWSVKEIIIHLADSETVVVTRMKRVIAEHKPLLSTMQQNLWTQNLNYSKIDHAPYLQLFKLLRDTMSEVLYTLEDGDFARVGIHDELGEMTLKQLIQRYIDHVHGHVSQINRVSAAYRARSQ